jgi:hypothetical protein
MTDGISKELERFTEHDEKVREPTLVAVLNDLIDRSVARGAVWLVHDDGYGPNLYAAFDPDVPETRTPTQALSVACERYWDLCRHLIIERALAAGGCLSADPSPPVRVPEIDLARYELRRRG